MSKKITARWIGCLLIVQLLISLSCKTAADIPSLFATPTPTPTITFTPSPTFTPTQTPSPTPFPSDVQFDVLPNGGTRVVDYGGKYTFVLSDQWTVLPADQETIIKMADSLEDGNPDLARALRSIKNLGPDALRLLALNSSRDTYENGTFANLNVASFRDRFSTTMDLSLLVDLSVKQIPAQLPNAKILSSGVEVNANGIPYGYIDIQLNAVINGQKLNAYEKIVMIQVDEYLSLFTFTAPNSRQKIFAPMIQEALDTLQLLDIYLSEQS